MVLDTVTSDLEGIGYAAIPIEIPACAVGAPHRRQRVWVVAHAGYGLGSTSGDGENFGRTDTSTTSRERIPNVADAELSGLQNNRRQKIIDGISETSSRSAPIGCGIQGRELESEWWATEPDVGRVAHGVPSRVDRLRALGNAIVPQVAEKIMRAIVEADTPASRG